MERITFLNAFLRTPDALFWDNQSIRAHQIIPFLMLNRPNTSIIGLCEVFRGYCKVMSKEAGRIGFKTICLEPFQLWQTSGLFFSYKSSIWTYIDHTQQSFGECCGFDCLATKGFLYVCLRHIATNIPVHFIVTHMNTNCSTTIQMAQLGHIHEFLAELPANAPHIVMGDFNMRIGNRIEDMKSSFLIKESGNTETTSIGGYGGPIDHIFVSNVQTGDTERISELNFLSDHYPVTREILL
jgi:hypothetical protein